jgi:hypothetical protein
VVLGAVFILDMLYEIWLMLVGVERIADHVDEMTGAEHHRHDDHVLDGKRQIDQRHGDAAPRPHQVRWICRPSARQAEKFRTWRARGAKDSGTWVLGRNRCPGAACAAYFPFCGSRRFC